MPLIAVTDVVQAAPDPGERLWGHFLDRPHLAQLLDGSAIDTWGWVLGRSSPARYVEFSLDGRLLRRVPVNVSRPDVAAVYPHVPGAAGSGFRTEIPIAGRQPEFCVQVACRLRDGSQVPLGRIVAERRWRDAYAGDRGPTIVSVVVPCFNQAHYLADALDSIRAQTYPHVEAVVIDDGSTDNTGAVVAQYPEVRCIRQANEGLAAARNAGLRHSSGMFLIFLDADDRLLPAAAEIGLATLAANPSAACTFGQCRWIALDGSPLPTPKHGCGSEDQFAALLRSNCTGMPATGMYRRGVFEIVHGFDTTPMCHGAQDYELALRIARDNPVSTHDGEVAEYRVHGTSLSRDTARMLDAVLYVLRSQGPYARTPQHRAALNAGVRFWKTYYGEPLARQVQGFAQRGEWGRFVRGVWALARRYPSGLAALVANSTPTRDYGEAG
jgi:glycosyltransferase involved in cell wall biosynthesis